MTKKDVIDFENSTKCWICDKACVFGDIKVRHNCHITGKYRGSAHRECNIKVKLNHFPSQKINVIPKGLENT